MEEDVLRTQQLPGKRTLDVCALCGRPIDRAASPHLTLDRSDAGSADTLVVCESCFQAAEMGELSYDAGIAAAIESADE
jgi:hypothetical protein